MNKNPTCLCLGALLLPFTLNAADTESVDQQEITELSPMVVIASKISRPLADVAGSVTVIDALEIERNSAQSIDDMLRYQPGINIDSAGTRFGGEGLNIRGIGGNRVVMEIDGVPVQSQFSLSNFSNTGRDTLEVETIKRVEILSGPASTLYGSRAIGGVMAVTTWDPDDLVGYTGIGVRTKAGYNSVDNSWIATGGVAWQHENTGLLAFYSRRVGHEVENMADKEFPDDKQDWNSDSLLTKFVWDSATGNRLRMTYNGFRKDAQTDIRSLLGTGRFRSTTELRGDDANSSDLLALDYSFSTDWLDQGVARVFYQDAATVQKTFETRAGRRPAQIDRQFYFDDSIFGLELNGFRQHITGSWVHNLGFGVEYQENKIREKRDALSTNLITGEVTNILLGEVYPTRDFPISTTRETSLFIHDEIELGDTGWRLIPGLRYDDYQMSPTRDSVYDTNNADVVISHVSDDGFSPKLGVLYRLAKDWSLFGQYARGFRAPPSQDINRSLYLPLFKYRVLPNPDLRSETSDGLEFGIRQSSRADSFSVSVFWTEYVDFIESAALLGFDSASGELRFQSRNITDARIYGAEIQWQQSLEQLVEGLSFEGGAYWSRGENLDNDQPLNTVSPPQLVAGLNWSSANQRFRTALITTFTAAQKRIDETDADRFATPSYAILDFTVGWEISQSVRLDAGIFNLLDKQYWRWSDVSKFAPDDPVIEVLSRPGRNISVNLKILR
ncbi:MAG: TonB-dependent hemoglobin/transferrin/lactoferrin family receptor [Xanthomonadales bacterium]|nr:TonB-dependent hemoglobin/transferrin/lactoferrin family receptor [Xanthomonadales bacterium]